MKTTRQAILDQQALNRKIYANDARYEKVFEQMELLGIQDVTTNRQHQNGTRVWKLPIKNQWNNGSLIEVASFKTGYVRNQGKSCHSNYQLNKRCDSEPQYYETAGFKPGEKLYRKFTTRTCVLIPKEIDRLEYLIRYCLKNYYIKHANFVANGEYVPKWRYESDLEHAKKVNVFDKYDCGHYDRIRDLKSDVYTQKQRGDGYKEGYEHQKMIARGFSHEIKELEKEVQDLKDIIDEKSLLADISITVNGEKYKVI